MNNRLEEVNYFNDHRTRPAKSITATIVDENGHDTEVELPTKWAVCSVCNGKGTHVNPNIDCNGLTAENFHDDPDFAEDYFSGVYDQPCNRCHGRTTEQIVDRKALTPELAKAYEQQLKEEEQQLKEEAADRACYLAEMRMGA